MDFPQVGVATNVTISNINFDNYVWLEKTDGIRVVIGILQDETMLELQSINDMHRDMKFVLDCEKYLDKYFIFDVLVSNNVNVMDKHYLERIDSVRDIKYEKFFVKQFYKISSLKELLEFIQHDVSPITKCNIDGVIITPINENYKNTHSLKIKRPELNTCDFYCKKIDDNKYLPFVQLNDKRYALRNIIRTTNAIDGLSLFATPFRNNDIIVSDIDIDGKIYECQFNGEVWIPVRERVDKMKPNGYVTCLTNFFNIFDPISENDSYFNDIMNIDKSTSDYIHDVSHIIRKYVVETVTPKFIKNVKNKINVLDLCGGRGGDLLGLYSCGVGNLFVVDSDKTALTKYCYKALNIGKYLKQYSNITNRRIVLDRNRLLLNIIHFELGFDNSELITEIQSRSEFRKFDLILMNYAVHYLCDDAAKMRELGNLVKQLLSRRGKFVVTYYNGDRILNGERKFGNIEIKINGNKAMMPLFTIDKTGYREEPLATNMMLNEMNLNSEHREKLLDSVRKYIPQPKTEMQKSLLQYYDLQEMLIFSNGV